MANRHGYADIKINPDDDQVTKKLAALHFYQLALRSPQPPAGSFDKAAADRGDALFSGKAQCNNCHVEPLWPEPGGNMHPARDVCGLLPGKPGAGQSLPDSSAGALFAHQKGGFYHDGRFATLMDVVNHYDTCIDLRLTTPEKNDLIQYLLSL